MPNDDAVKMKAVLDDCVARAAHPQMVPQTERSPAAEPPDVLDQLPRLGELRDSNVVTTEEFDIEKAFILGHQARDVAAGVAMATGNRTSAVAPVPVRPKAADPIPGAQVLAAAPLHAEPLAPAVPQGAGGAS